MRHVKLPYGTDPSGFYWPSSDQKRSELLAVKRGSPSDFEAIYQCRPGNRNGSVFLESDFSYYLPPQDLFLGVSSHHVREFVGRGHGVFQAWDTAASTTSTAAWTVCTTGLFVPCAQYHLGEDAAVLGPCDPHFDVMILDVYREKVGWGDLNNAFRQQTRKWQPDLSLVEDRSTGISLLQSFESSGYRIKGIKARASKRDRATGGIDIGGGVGSVQGWFRMHRVLFPDGAVWVPALKSEMKDFSGADDSASDQVDSMVHLITHAITVGSANAMLPTGWTPERGTPEDHPETLHNSPQEGPGAFFTLLGELEDKAIDPFSGLCGRCKYLANGVCDVYGVAKMTLDTCAFQEDTNG